MVFFFIGGQQINNSNDQTWSQIKNKCLSNTIGSRAEGSPIQNLGIEKFKLGNLDNLMNANDQLLKLETQMEAVLKKIERQYQDIEEKQKHDLLVLTNDKQKTTEQYVWEFQWDDQKYPRNNQLTDVIKNLTNRMNVTDLDLRKNANALQELKSQAQQYTKKETSILNQDLVDLLKDNVVKPGDFVYSKTITTVICFVPLTHVEQWKIRCNYLSPNVIPNTFKPFEQIPVRDGHQVWRVNLFTLNLDYDYLGQMQLGPRKDKIQMKNEVDDSEEQVKRLTDEDLQKFKEDIIKHFAKRARDELKVIVKEFQYVQGQSQQRENDKNKLEFNTQTQTKKLKDTCQIAYSEIYQSYVHLKYLRFIVDIVMRFGKTDIFSCIIKPVQGKEKNIQQQLMSIFLKQGDAGLYGTKEELEESEDFFPFAYVPINI